MTTRSLWFTIVLLMTSCGGNPGNPTPEASRNRINDARAAARAMLLDPKQALLERSDYVVDDESLIGPALDQILRNVEFWLNKDPYLLDQQIRAQTDTTRKEILVSDAGIAALQRKVAARFSAPAIQRTTISNPGVKATAFEKRLSELAGIVLSGRPAQAKDLPPEAFVQVEADYGLLPAPMEQNSRAKGYISLLRYRAAEDATSGGWIGSVGSPPRPEIPAQPVIARCARNLIQQQPDASRVILHFSLLRRMGQPIRWRFQFDPASDGLTMQGEGYAPGYAERVIPILWTASQLETEAAKAPAIP